MRPTSGDLSFTGSEPYYRTTLLAREASRIKYYHKPGGGLAIIGNGGGAPRKLCEREFDTMRITVSSDGGGGGDMRPTDGSDPPVLSSEPQRRRCAIPLPVIQVHGMEHSGAPRTTMNLSNCRSRHSLSISAAKE